MGTENANLPLNVCSSAAQAGKLLVRRRGKDMSIHSTKVLSGHLEN